MITSPHWLDEDRVIAQVATRVPRWIEEIPLYRQLLPEGVRHHASADFTRIFSALPIITKREIREGFPRNFLRAGVVLDQLVENDLIELEQTSGTSEEPVPLLLARGWWDQQERAALELNPWVARVLRQNPQNRRATLTSPSCNHDICYKGIPPRSERIVGNTLSLNLTRHPFLWPETELERMTEEILGWQPVFLDVDPVYGVCLARYCARAGIQFPSLKFVLSSYEYLSVAHRRSMQRVWGVPVFNLYGSTETGHLLMETESGQMVPSTATAFLELLHPDPQGIGELVVTTLGNEYMPLIRYGIGDLARMHRGVGGSPRFELHGRARDTLTNANGAQVTVRQVDENLAQVSHVIHYQLRQNDQVEYTLLVILDETADVRTVECQLQESLADLLKTRFPLTVVPLDYIAGEPSGKFRLCCRLV
jgi:phenylacetate-CoA ligase